MDKRIIDRFYSYIQKTDGCWFWKNFLNNSGYGRFFIKNDRYVAHRFSYELHKGKIPEGLEIDHLCKVRHCVNPNHLEAVTHAENVKRGKRANQTHCKRGHELSKDNIRITYKKSGTKMRQCILCIKERRSSHDTHLQI